MFFIHALGRRSISTEAETLEELGERVEQLMNNGANNEIVVSVGLDDSAVMPYTWIYRDENDDWKGTLGDCVKLGLDHGMLIEHDPTTDIPTIEELAEMIRKPAKKKQKEQPKKKKLTNEEMVREANRMVKDLFAALKEEENG